MTVVLVTPRRTSAIERFLPLTTLAFAGIECRYRVYRVAERIAPVRLTDPLDGTLLIALHTFDSEEAAREWICNDDDQRRSRRKLS